MSDWEPPVWEPSPLYLKYQDRIEAMLKVFNQRPDSMIGVRFVSPDLEWKDKYVELDAADTEAARAAWKGPVDLPEIDPRIGGPSEKRTRAMWMPLT